MPPYQLPPLTRPFLNAASGIKWNLSQRIERLNWLRGLYPNSAQLFELSTGQRVLMYESKFDIDADGSGGDQTGGKDTYLPDTSLHSADGKPLNSYTVPFAVIPLRYRDRATMAKQPWLGEFVNIGDVGMAFYKGAVKEYIYGDYGPGQKIGEGSVDLAKALGINPSPLYGGIQGIPPQRGVVHVAFLGSARNSAKHAHPTTTLETAEIAALARSLFQDFKR